jgi:hypothetical protein
MPLDTRNAGLNRASRTVAKTASVTHAFATGLFTVAASFLKPLQPGDVIVLSALTGGTGITAGKDYYLLAPNDSASGAQFDDGETTFRIATTPGGAPVLGSSNISAGTITHGRIVAADEGVLRGNIIGQRSQAGRDA